MHEGGHAWHEWHTYDSKKLAPFNGDWPIFRATSFVIQEMHAKLFELILGRNASFLTKVFGKDLGANAFKATNLPIFNMGRVGNGPILHDAYVAIRTRIELDLMVGALSPVDIFDRWASDLEEYTGRSGENAVQLLLGEVHWYCSILGGVYQRYLLGSLYAHEAARIHFSEATDFEISWGTFLDVLCREVSRKGALANPRELTFQGQPIHTNVDSYFDFISGRLQRAVNDNGRLDQSCELSLGEELN